MTQYQSPTEEFRTHTTYEDDFAKETLGDGMSPVTIHTYGNHAKFEGKLLNMQFDDELRSFSPEVLTVERFDGLDDPFQGGTYSIELLNDNGTILASDSHSFDEYSTLPARPGFAFCLTTDFGHTIAHKDIAVINIYIDPRP